MADAAQEGHAAADHAAQPAAAAAGQAAVVGERLGEAHADARADGGRQADQERFPGIWVAKAAANSGASVETEPSIRPARPGCTTCKTNSRRTAVLPLRAPPGWFSGASSAADLVPPFLLGEVAQQLPQVRVGDLPIACG